MYLVEFCQNLKEQLNLLFHLFPGKFIFLSPLHLLHSFCTFPTSPAFLITSRFVLKCLCNPDRFASQNLGCNYLMVLSYQNSLAGVRNVNAASIMQIRWLTKLQILECRTVQHHSYVRASHKEHCFLVVIYTTGITVLHTHTSLVN